MIHSTAIGALRLVMLGSLPPPIGGTTVSFAALCDFAAQRVGRCQVIDTGRRARGNIGAATRAIRHLLSELRRTDIVTMHFSDRAAITIGPILAAICLVAGKPFVFRQFGGEFDRTVAALPEWHRALLRRTIFRADRVLLQTKGMVQNLTEEVPQANWFPTARPRTSERNPLDHANARCDRLRCLYMGHVSRAKGALIAARAVGRIASAELSIYGPLADLSATELAAPGVEYRGIADPRDVSRIMARHDLLLFPSTHSGEGYSGTLIEAAMVGLPIVANRWQSLPEMFSDDEVMFVPPGDFDAITQAIESFADRRADAVARSGRLIERSRDFDADAVFGSFLDKCAEVVAEKAGNTRCVA